MTITHVKIGDSLYNVAHLTSDTLAEFIKELPRGNAVDIMRKYRIVKEHT